ncbi:phosphatase PAP2 family protein [Terriglobus roseus]|uniref:Acid phosphatase n=1 Tax=Terriglobus roseus TaxID=392734 RepID=A0A1G7GRG3_9BACT|nr:phosphatase PAP2 family protein [Terriglobus roseus]SDE90681.1 acid phosphatase (class A) [Terriglobus roseus]
MRQLTTISLFTSLLLCGALHAQEEIRTGTDNSMTGHTKAVHASRFLDLATLNLNVLIADPPAQNSTITDSELRELHAIESHRTNAQVAAAQADDAEEDIFVYHTIFGASFTAKNLPILAALSTDVHNEESVASVPLKTVFSRPRPYQADKTLHPVCKLTEASNSYPSGHTLSGYLEGYTLAELIPSRRDEILARTDDYAHNRLVCGVHYASDLAAGRQLAAVLFGSLMSNPAFRQRLDAAREELHAKFPTAVASR